MDFQGLQRALAPTGTTITVGTDTLPGSLSDFVARYYSGEGRQIQIDGAEVTLDEASRAVRVTGRANFLGVANLPVKATFSLDAEGNPGAVITYTLRDRSGSMSAWKFSTSFPEIPADPAALAVGARTPFLDSLTLLEAYFVVASHDYTDPAMRAELGEGISFLGRAAPVGLIGVLSGVLDDAQTIPLHGRIRIPVDETDLPVAALGKDLGRARTYPWEIEPALPGLHLEAPLGAELSLGKLKIRDTRLRIFSPLSWAWISADDVFEPLTALTGTLDIPSAGIAVDMVLCATTEIVRGSRRPEVNAFVEARCEGLSIGNLAHLADVVGPGDLSSALPDELSGAVRALEKVSLLDLSFSLSARPAGLYLTSASVAIGAPGARWRVWGDHVAVTDIGVRFTVGNPLAAGAGASTFIDVWGTTVLEGVPVQIKASKASGGFVLTGALKEKETLPLKRLMKAYLPAVPPPADLTINDLRVSIDPNGFQLSGALAQSPDRWELALGPAKLAIRDCVFDFIVVKNGPTLGMFRGAIDFGKGVSLAMAYTTPGSFVVRARCEKIALGHLIATLVNQKAALPAGFDITLLDSTILIEEGGAGLRFQLATRVDTMGCFAFEARSLGGGTWGFAAGLDLAAGKLSSIPGLGALKAIEGFVQLQKLLLVVSSFDSATFQFPDMAQFNTPQLASKNLALPASAGGLAAGLMVFAEWQLDPGDKTHNLLMKLLGLGATQQATLMIGEDPAKEAKLFFSQYAKIQGQPFNYKLGVVIQNGKPGMFLTGSMIVKIQGQPQTFDVTAVFVPTGAFLSATMKGSAPVDCKVFKLSNLALEIGVNWGGIPSLGVAATIDTKRFSSSIAVFFDSTNPAQSLIAGSVSDITLKDVADTLLGGAVPSAIDGVLETVAIQGTQRFKIPGDLAAALDGRDIAEVAAAFSASGRVQIPSAIEQVLLCTKKKGAAWHLTDMTKMRHYALTRRGEDIEVSVEAQLYFAPMPTMIGTIRFPQGYYLSCAVELFGFGASATVEMIPTKGLSIDAQMDRIVLGNENVFVISAAKGKGGPQLSVSTMTRRENPVKELRQPHIYIQGRARLLGIEQSAYVRVNKKGAQLELKGPLAPGAEFDLDVELGGGGLLVDGDIKVGIGTVNLGELGKVKVNTDVEGSLGVRVSGKKIEIAVDGSFQFMGNEVSIGRFRLDAKPDALAKLAEKMTGKVADQLREVFKDATRWTGAVKGGVVEGVEDTEKVLKNVFKKSDKEAKQLAKGAATITNDAGKAVAGTAKKFGKKVKKLF